MTLFGCDLIWDSIVTDGPSHQHIQDNGANGDIDSILRSLEAPSSQRRSARSPFDSSWHGGIGAEPLLADLNLVQAPLPYTALLPSEAAVYQEPISPLALPYSPLIPHSSSYLADELVVQPVQSPITDEEAFHILSFLDGGAFGGESNMNSPISSGVPALVADTTLVDGDLSSPTMSASPSLTDSSFTPSPRTPISTFGEDSPTFNIITWDSHDPDLEPESKLVAQYCCCEKKYQKPSRHWRSCPYNPDRRHNFIECHICGFQFKGERKDNLKRHLETKHAVNPPHQVAGASKKKSGFKKPSKKRSQS